MGNDPSQKQSIGLNARQHGMGCALVSSLRRLPGVDPELALF